MALYNVEEVSGNSEPVSYAKSGTMLNRRGNSLN